MLPHTQTTSVPTVRWLSAVTPAQVLRIVWLERFWVLVIVAICTVIGIIIALVMQPEFRSEARIIPEMNSASGDMFKRLASVAGFTSMDFSDAEGVDAVRPDLYPNVLQSVPFRLFLIDQPVITMDGQSTTVGLILLPEQSKGLWKWLKSFGTKTVIPPAGKRVGPLYLSARQQELTEDISDRVSAKLDTRSGIITITAQMPDALVAATVAQRAMDYLTRYVSSYRTGKAREDFQFYRQRLGDAQRRYQSAQLRLFQYNDQHKYVVMQAATMEKQRLEAELSIAQTVYTELSRQFEQARLKIQERTPIFKILEPPQIPHRRVSPKRTILVLCSAVIGLMVGVVYAVARQMDVIGHLRASVLIHAQDA